MREIGGDLVVDAVGTIGEVCLIDDDFDRRWVPADACLPDLTDPATVGVLLSLYDSARATRSCPDPVYTCAAVYGLLARQTVDALVAALEAAAALEAVAALEAAAELESPPDPAPRSGLVER